jgi:hypothetical protein
VGFHTGRLKRKLRKLPGVELVRQRNNQDNTSRCYLP